MTARGIGQYSGVATPPGGAGPMKSGAVIYEVSLEIEAGAAVEFDRWLAGHVEAMLALPGFVEAHTFHADDESEGVGAPSIRRVVHYTLASRADLDRYLREHADRMRADGQRMFGGRLLASRRILSEGSHSSRQISGEGTHCRNCGLSLKGQYCSGCGQRARVRMITVWELLRDLFGDVFELDSRLWRSLVPLLFKPGFLTREYLEGRRVRYMPPFRMYLVLSVLFFLLVSLFSDADGIRFTSDEDGASISTQIGADGAEGEETADADTDSVGSAEPANPSARPTKDAVKDESPNLAADVSAKDADEEKKQNDDQCDLEVSKMTTGIGWLDRRLSEEHLEEVCRQVVADQGKTAIREFLRNTPTMMFFFLPLIAVLMKFLYPLSKRYYVEHLLFFVHYHAFFFLVLALLMLWGRVVTGLTLPGWLSTIPNVVVGIYIPVYLFLAMRRVYGQGRLATSFKYMLLGVGYFICLVVTFMLTLIITALTL